MLEEDEKKIFEKLFTVLDVLYVLCEVSLFETDVPLLSKSGTRYLWWKFKFRRSVTLTRWF